MFFLPRGLGVLHLLLRPPLFLNPGFRSLVDHLDRSGQELLVVLARHPHEVNYHPDGDHRADYPRCPLERVPNRHLAPPSDGPNFSLMTSLYSLNDTEYTNAM